MTDSPAINGPRGGDGKHAILDKIVVPKNSSENLREELDQIGINEGTMFPDLDGLGKHIAWEWKTRIAPSGPKKSTGRSRGVRNPKAVSPSLKER